MVYSATFDNISAISWWSVYWWRKLECLEKTTDLSLFADKLFHIMLYQVHIAMNDIYLDEMINWNNMSVSDEYFIRFIQDSLEIKYK